MKTISHRTALLLIALASAVGAAAPVEAQPGTGGGSNNVVIVQNQEDGTLRSRASAQIGHAGGEVIANTNLAQAEASCTDCQVVAVAVQVVIASGEGSVFEPGNAAIAVNSGCSGCRAFAYARQEFLWVDRPVPLRGEAQAQIHALEAEMQDVAASGISDEEMEVALNDLSEQLIAVVQDQIWQAGTVGVRTTGFQVDRKEG